MWIRKITNLSDRLTVSCSNSIGWGIASFITWPALPVTCKHGRICEYNFIKFIANIRLILTPNLSKMLHNMLFNITKQFKFYSNRTRFVNLRKMSAPRAQISRNMAEQRNRHFFIQSNLTKRSRSSENLSSHTISSVRKRIWLWWPELRLRWRQQRLRGIRRWQWLRWTKLQSRLW